MSFLRVFAISVSLFSFSASAQAQINFPAASPHGTLEQSVGLTEVSIDYSRPSMRGREIYGNLVPWGEVWRTGANNPTKITFSSEVKIGDTKIEAGSYALYTIPGKDEWTVIIYGETDGWGAFGYDKTKDVARVNVKPTKLASNVETFTLSIGELDADGANINLDWESTRVSIPLEVGTTDKVMAQIKEKQGSEEFNNSNVLFGAASFYHDNGYELETALKWVTKAVEAQDQPAYWMYARKARIEADLGLKEAALASAKRTKDLAQQGGNMDFVRIAEDVIASL